MTTFDDLTLGEVEEISTTVLGGKDIASDEANPLMVAGGIMWIMRRRQNGSDPPLTWEDFKNKTTMAEIKAFSMDMEAQTELDPTSVRNVPTN